MKETIYSDRVRQQTFDSLEEMYRHQEKNIDPHDFIRVYQWRGKIYVEIWKDHLYEGD